MRLLGRRRRARVPPSPVLVDDGSLVVIVRAYDPARADSEVLAEAVAGGVDVGAPVLVRHHLVLPLDRLVEAAELVAYDGYQLRTTDQRDDRDRVHARASRVQLLTALSAAQERSRMAGLAQRLGGDVAGWDALAAGRDVASD